MLKLPQVTLCCVDTRLPDMALDAMKKCMAHIDFGEALLFTCSQHGLRDVPERIKIIELDTIKSVEDYSHFMVKGLQPYLKTSHMLIVQWDGYVIDPSMWHDDFLSVDYIGAVWPQFKDAHRVGNGGFSLRSRKLLDALASEDIVPHHPEDMCIARAHRTQLEQQFGICFASEAIAKIFAHEREKPPGVTFGFHGLSNMANLMTESDLEQFIGQAPASLFSSVEARGFIKNLSKRKLPDLAKNCLQKRLINKSMDFSDFRLWLRLVF